MAIITTPAGIAHVAQLVAGDPTTNTFDAIELGNGNNSVAVAGNRSWLTPKIPGTLIEVSPGYPIKGDTDIRNEFRDEDSYTWRFVIPETSDPVVASNAIVTKFNMPVITEPIMVQAAEVLAKSADQEMTIFVNLTEAGAPSITAHVNEGSGAGALTSSWTRRAAMLSGGRGSRTVSPSHIESRGAEQGFVFTAARLMNDDGSLLRTSDVFAVRLHAFVSDSAGGWSLDTSYALAVHGTVYDEPVRGDSIRWPHSAGYTFAHSWWPSSSIEQSCVRLEYILVLRRGRPITLVHDVEFTPSWDVARVR